MTQTPFEQIFIVEATNWKEAVITLLEPESAYTPWRCGSDEAEEGDAVAFVLNTDPLSVVTRLGRVGDDGDPSRAVITPNPMDRLGLVDLETLVMMTGFGWKGDPRTDWVLRGEMAIRLSLALEDCRYGGDQYTRCGHNPVAAARVLLHSRGRCTGCDEEIHLDSADACEEVHLHTVDAHRRDTPTEDTTVDWPGALCTRCVARMNKDGYTSLVDYRLAQHPSCPSCGAQRTRSALFGMRTSNDYAPWFDLRGCCVTPDDWTCGECGVRW